MSFIRRFLGVGPATPNSKDPDSVQVIAARLEALPPDRARYLAAYAYVLARVAYADEDLHPEELNRIGTVLAERGGLGEDQASLVADLASSESADRGGTQDYVVTRLLARIATKEQRVEILDGLLAVAAADGTIEVSEEDEVRQIARQLGFHDSQYLDALAHYRDLRSVLRGMPGS
ncbi:MAG: TerB family tellurite resistance protein [Myxococcota bacterium]|nr:TerB family tellurite resistance protein [Myxococcota bacterium]